MKLKSVVNEEGKLTVIFNIAHNDLTTTVDQDLILKRTSTGWVADMRMEEFPEQKTSTEAALKLGEWLERLGAEIKKHTFDEINLEGIK